MSRPHPDWDTDRRRAARARIKAGDGFLYVAEYTGKNIIKIGHSLDPERRCKTMAPWPVRLLAKTPGSLLDEKRIHRALIQHRLRRCTYEEYPRSILSHPSIPAELRSAA